MDGTNSANGVFIRVGEGKSSELGHLIECTGKMLRTSRDPLGHKWIVYEARWLSGPKRGNLMEHHGPIRDNYGNWESIVEISFQIL